MRLLSHWIEPHRPTYYSLCLLLIAFSLEHHFLIASVVNHLAGLDIEQGAVLHASELVGN